MYSSVSCADSGTTLHKRGYRDPKSELMVVDQGRKQNFVTSVKAHPQKYSNSFRKEVPRMKSEYHPDGLLYKNAGPGTRSMVGPTTYDTRPALRTTGLLGIDVKDGCRESAAFRPVHKPRNMFKLADPNIQLNTDTRLGKTTFVTGVHYHRNRYSEAFRSKTSRLVAQQVVNTSADCMRFHGAGSETSSAVGPTTYAVDKITALKVDEPTRESAVFKNSTGHGGLATVIALGGSMDSMAPRHHVYVSGTHSNPSLWGAGRSRRGIGQRCEKAADYDIMTNKGATVSALARVHARQRRPWGRHLGDVQEGEQGAHTFKRPAPWVLQDNEQKVNEAKLGGGERAPTADSNEGFAQERNGVEEFGEDSLVAGKQAASMTKAEPKKRGPQVVKWSTSRALGALQDAPLAVIEPEWSTLTEQMVLRRPAHDRDLLGGCIDQGRHMSLSTQQILSKQNYSASFNSAVPRFTENNLEDFAHGAVDEEVVGEREEPAPVIFTLREEKKASSMFKNSTGHQDLSHNAFWQSHHR
jgi:hypothetical protein